MIWEIFGRDQLLKYQGYWAQNFQACSTHYLLIIWKICAENWGVFNIPFFSAKDIPTPKKGQKIQGPNIGGSQNVKIIQYPINHCCTYCLNNILEGCSDVEFNYFVCLEWSGVTKTEKQNMVQFYRPGAVDDLPY